ncbi:MAG: C-terminal binding protein [Dehalococcoidia bacterium]|nr:MAG: C-terminal binding protein [Dehalococcoidia bacterium]
MAFKVVDILGLSALADYEAMFKQAGVEVELAVRSCPFEATEDEIIAAARDADAVIAQAAYQNLSRRVLSGLDNCRFLITVGIGYDKLDVDAATEFGIMAANVPDYCLEEVSDHAMALILACTRRVVQLNEIAKRGDWKLIGDPSVSVEVWPKMSRLRGHTLGIIGLGRTARALVPKAKGFGLRIIACDPHLAPEVFGEFEVEQVELDQLLDQSDIVSIHAPLTSETRHLFRLEQLKKMKPTACLINTARGELVDHEALYNALSDGIISAAAFDVTEPEPIPADSPLLKLDNFIVTDHSAHASPTATAALPTRPLEDVIRVVRGDLPAGLINPQVMGKYRQKWG